jgi:DNA primase
MAKGGFDPVVERVREATDIVEIVGAHVTLKKVGSRLSGLCPFHQEKTPSFYVNPVLQAFHCFGCGVGGDVFSFLMQHDKMSFPEALRYLAERAGIQLPERKGPPTDQLERIREALRVARAFYREYLQGPAGVKGREYLARRGIGEEIAERYGLGLSPDAWDGLVRHARSLLSERTLCEAGLAVESEGGRVYDRFRNRLMVPIENPGGAPVGFGGRALGDQEPKYLNSPETPVYHKGGVLFGVGPAREGCRKEGRLVVVEGYFDVISLVQAGIDGVVGTCGTALTPDQAHLLRRVSERVVLLFDGDSAGLRAAHRALSVLVGEVPEVLVATPPRGKDPDLWVREDGPEAVRAVLDHPRGALAFLQDLGEQQMIRPREAMEQAVRLAAQVADPLQRDLWIQETAARFGVRVEAVHQALRAVKPTGGPAPPAAAGAGRGAGVSQGKGRTWSPLARECLRTSLAHPEHAAEIARGMSESGLVEEDLAELIGWIGERLLGAGEVSLAAVLSQAAREHPLALDLTAVGLERETAAESPETILRLLHKQRLSQEMERLGREIRRAQEAGHKEEEEGLLRRKLQLAQERARLEDGPARREGG